MSRQLAIKAASMVADILSNAHVGDNECMLIMDRLADGLEAEHPHVLAKLVAELRLVIDTEEELFPGGEEQGELETTIKLLTPPKQ